MEVMLDAVKSIPNAYLAIIGDGPTAHLYGAMHGEENRLYCKPRFLDHEELAEVISHPFLRHPHISFRFMPPQMFMSRHRNLRHWAILC